MTKMLYNVRNDASLLAAYFDCIARPKRATELHDNSDQETHAGSEAIPFHYMPTTSNRHTYKLQLPAFMLNTATTPITLFYVYEVKRFGRGQHKDRFNRRAECHLLYCKFLGLCKACDCSGTTLCTRLNYGSCGTILARHRHTCTEQSSDASCSSCLGSLGTACRSQSATAGVVPGS